MVNHNQQRERGRGSNHPYLDHLETAGVQEHLFELDIGILGSEFPAAFEEETVAHPHDVGFVHRRHALATLLPGEIEGVSAGEERICQVTGACFFPIERRGW